MKRGYVRIRTKGKVREEFLRECERLHIPLREIRFTEAGETECDIPARMFSELDEEEVTLLRESREERLKGRVRKNPGILVLMSLLILCTAFSALFIWDIRIEGNTQVQEEEIRDTLGELGIGIGTFRPTLRAKHISNEVLLRIPELSWMSVNIRGCRLHILVREKRPVPEVAKTKETRNIVAARDGIVEKIVVLRGKSSVAVGDAVTKGQVLIASDMPSLHSGDRQVWAEGVIRARTGYVLEASDTAVELEKRYTGRTCGRYALLLGKRRINFYFNSGNPYGSCDKIYSDRFVILPGGVETPFCILREQFAEYRPEDRSAEEETERELRGFLLDQLHLRVGETGEILKTEYSTEKTGGRITVILTAECSEEIGIPEEGGA